MQVTDKREAFLLSEAITLAIEVLLLLPEAERSQGDLNLLGKLMEDLKLPEGDWKGAQQTAMRRIAILLEKPMSADILPFPPR